MKYKMIINHTFMSESHLVPRNSETLEMFYQKLRRYHYLLMKFYDFLQKTQSCL